MTFLERILATKNTEIEHLKQQSQLHEFIQTGRHPQTGQPLLPCRGFRRAIESGNRLGLVAEVKQASPSKGQIAVGFNPVQTAIVYEQAGASAVSVLTDETYFRGSLTDLRKVREAIQLPVLRKDFIVDELQIAEARLAGADAVLLICAALSPKRLAELSGYAAELGLDTLIEVHSEAELPAALAANPTVIGINNRNLHTFEVSLETTQQILKQVPNSIVAISESGIQNVADAERMRDYGAQGILVGEALMRAGAPNQVAQLVQSLRVPRRARLSAISQTTTGDLS